MSTARITKKTPKEAREEYQSFQKALEMHKSAKAEVVKEKEELEKSLRKRNRKPPISINDLTKIAQQKAAKADREAKPVFKTKKQRQAEALKRLEARKKDADNVRKGVTSMDWTNPERRDRVPLSVDRERRAEDRKRHEELKRLQEIKNQYLGVKKPKKKIIPPSQKFKFSFDWDAQDDTSDTTNPLYKNKMAGSLMYGRGFMAGVDRRMQRKQMTFYDDLVEQREAGAEIKVMDLRDMDKVQKREEKERARAKIAKMVNRHWKKKNLDEMSARDWRIFREDFNIMTRGNRVPNPIRYWNESKLPKIILKTLDKIGYKDPSPIQRCAIPIGLQNRDMVGIAQTGSGKTAAFLLPLFVYIDKLPRLTPVLAQDGPYAVILAPSRELAQQIAGECDKLSYGLKIRNVAIVGGLSIQDQGFFIREGAEICIATPGRLFDCIERRYLVLNQCNYMILDEADRMIDMNFEPQIVKIIEAMPATNLRPVEEEQWEDSRTYRQTTMFSATMPLKVELLAKKYLRNPIFISIGDRAGNAAKTVTQTVIWSTSENQKRTRIESILREQEPPVIVFCNQKGTCDTVSKWLDSTGHSSTVIHGGKVQEHRMENLALFKDGHVDILVATDVVGRGIDISGVKLVINYELPASIQRYTHRIGRTGRAGLKGVAISFLSPNDTEIMYDLKEMLESAKQIVPEELRRHPDAQVKPGTVGKKRRRDTVIYAKH